MSRVLLQSRCLYSFQHSKRSGIWFQQDLLFINEQVYVLVNISNSIHILYLVYLPKIGESRKHLYQPQKTFLDNTYNPYNNSQSFK